VVENDGLAARSWAAASRTRASPSRCTTGESPRPDHALRYLEAQIVPKLDRAGLAWSFGRMVLEVRPPVAIDRDRLYDGCAAARRIQRT